MKRIVVITGLILSIAVCASAEQQNSIGGLLIGAGGGAVMGQVIGRDTEATLIGTAVGGVVGYIIGNEMDKDRRGYSRPAQNRPIQHKRNYNGHPHHRPKPVVYKQKQVTNYNYNYVPVVKTPPPPKKQCKKAEILGTVHGKAKKIYGTVCKTRRGWELMPEGQHRDRDYHNSGRVDYTHNENKHFQNYAEQNWTYRRF